MEEKFVLFKLNLTKGFDFLLLNLQYETPIEYLDEVLKLINSYDQVNIIFDNMLVNGETFNRYVSGQILKGKLDLTSIEIIDQNNVPIEVQNLVYPYFKNSAEKLDQGFFLLDKKRTF